MTMQRVRERLAAVNMPALGRALAFGTVGGALFAWLNLPLAWMIGAMLAAALAAIAGVRVVVPPGLRSGMIMVLGIMLGSAFDPDILAAAQAWGLSLAGLVVYIMAATAVGIVYLRRVARVDPVTAFFTATPGGLNEMVLVGGAMGGDDRTISLVHAARIMLVVMTLPFWFQLLAGYEPGARGALGPALTGQSARDLVLLTACAAGAPMAKALRIPAATLVGPMLLSAALHLAGLTEARPPGVLVAAAQVVVGTALGCRFVGVDARRLGRGLAAALGLTAVMLALTVLCALVPHAATGLPVPALILAYAPGGLAEMSLVALALGVDPAFVSTHHILRILLIVLVAPQIFHLHRRWITPPRDAEPGHADD